MEPRDPERVAKIQCINALFYDATAHDPFLNESVLEGIEQALAGEGAAPVSLDEFSRRARELSVERTGREPSFDLCHLNLRERSYDPLFIRGELLGHLKRLAGYPRALLVVSGLEAAVDRLGGARRKRDRVLEEARRYIDALTSRFAAPGCCVTVLYLD